MGTLPSSISDEKRKALNYLASGIPAETRNVGEIRRLAGDLERQSEPGWARSVLFKRFKEGVPDECLRRYRQLIARTVYKDPEVRRLDALRQALDFLADQAAVATAPEPSSFVKLEQHALTGAIHKRRWELTGDVADLTDARDHYRLATEVAPPDTPSAPGPAPEPGCGHCDKRCWLGDDGAHYPLINLAFVLDRLAGADGAKNQLDEVNKVRAKVVELTKPQMKEERWSWPKASAIEAHVGRKESDRALAILDGLAIGEVANWQGETTASQIATVLNLRLQRDGVLDDSDVEVMRRILDWPEGVARDEIVRYVRRAGDRMGLALSGGGFRASLFHLGVLAALAEFDVLRDLETISCVSGGSIAGAAYYVDLKRMLEETESGDITRDHYVGVVQQTLERLTDVVTTMNVRNRAFVHPASLLRMLRGQNVSDRVAALFDEVLYADDEGNTRLLLDTTIQPPADAVPFSPKQHNWRRAAKVPSLLVNATSTNTGYVWQFTSTWMGENPSAVVESIDAVDLVERIWLDDTKSAHWITLGQAVAASAAVPGLFPPVPLRKVVDGRVVRLVDGGVADNQGMVGLRDQDCNSIVVSDASGQHSHKDKPSRLRTLSLLRSGSLGRAALRRANLTALRVDSGWPRRHWFVHLTKGLEPGLRGVSADPVEFAEVTGSGIEVQSAHDGYRAAPDLAATRRGLPRRVQAKLAALRTDLDRFSPDEANALMCSGYLQTIEALTEQPPASASTRVFYECWPFLEGIGSKLAYPSQTSDDYEQLVADLDRGQHLFFRRLRRLWPRRAERFMVR